MFSWDEDKNRLNQKKHGISFEEAKTIFDGPVYTKIDDREDYGEERLLTLGMMGNLAVIVVAHTERDGSIRIISARKATNTEQRIYHEKIHQEIFPEAPRSRPRKRR
jgi:uncharacterized DUF497 family protein